MPGLDDLFPSRDEPADGLAAAIGAVSARLGQPTERPCTDGHRLTIVAGALDGERSAWVEQRWRDAGYEGIDEHTLHLRIGDERRRTWTVDTCNPWFGCTIHHVRWLGDEIWAIYTEKHRTIASVVGRAGHLPEGTSCSFWVDWSQAAFAEAQSLFPAGMSAAWASLRPRATELLALGQRR